MVVNKDLYEKKHKNTSVKFVSPDYRTAVRECAIDGKFSSAWTIDAAASVLGTKILSIYPPVNGLLDKTVSILHRTFNPNKDCSPRPPIVLMWSNVSRPGTGVGTWLPNHFVPLLMRMKQLKVSNVHWKQKTEEEKEQVFRKFMKGLPERKRAISSTDGLLSVPRTPKIARKPGQRKRVKNIRTRTKL